MPSLHHESSPADAWPASPDIDGYTWGLGPEPSDEDLRWWAEHSDDIAPPDDHLDRLAGESEALDYLERGLAAF